MDLVPDSIDRDPPYLDSATLRHIEVEAQAREWFTRNSLACAFGLVLREGYLKVALSNYSVLKHTTLPPVVDRYSLPLAAAIPSNTGIVSSSISLSVLPSTVEIT